MTTLSVGEDFPNQQARVRVILGYYREIGPAGAFMAAMIEQTLRDADAAIASGDIFAILRTYQEMKEIKE